MPRSGPGPAAQRPAREAGRRGAPPVRDAAPDTLRRHLGLLDLPARAGHALRRVRRRQGLSTARAAHPVRRLRLLGTRAAPGGILITSAGLLAETAGRCINGPP